jgi:hypothetical protein
LLICVPFRAQEYRRVVLICYYLADWDVAPAVKFLNGKAPKRRWPALAEEEVGRIVENVYLAETTTVEHVLALSDMDDPLCPEALREALHYVEQWRVAKWVTEQNCTRGTEPPTDECAVQHERLIAGIPIGLKPRSIGCGSGGTARKSGSRWRALWAGTFSELPPRVAVPIGEMHSKAW